MSLLGAFNNFYNNLSSNGLFFFWIVVFLFVFLVFLLIVLYFKNKKLVKMVKEKNSVIDDNSDDIIANDNYNINVSEVEKEEEIPEIKEEVKIDENKSVNIKSEEIIPEVKKESSAYQKNVLKEMNTRTQTSPINIENKNNDKDNSINDTISINDLIDNEDLDDNKEVITSSNEFVSPLEEMEDIYEVNDSMKFANEVIDKMEKETTSASSNIELTEYEKKQEEEAIISYSELEQVKDKIYNITDDEETDEFIDELKNFRIDLD